MKHDSIARASRWLAGAGWLLLAAAVVEWVMLRRGAARHAPAVLALLVSLVLVCLGVRALGLVRMLIARPERRITRAAELALIGGVLLALSAGMANWALRLQGTVILNEEEAVPLHGGTALQVFEAGFLSRLEEMGLTLALVEVELVPAGVSGFYPASTLEVLREGGEPKRLRISPRGQAEAGALRFHQGAFGFAPRIVVLRDGRTVFDRVVPFLTERHGPAGLSFAGSFTVEKEDLRVEGSVDLASLDEGMRGHADLVLALTRSGEPLGRGALQPGHFADLEQGYRVGFAGLERWSEIVISRRNYGRLVLAGGALAVIGLVLLPIAAWRRW
jgi:hypothetical protein